MLLQIHGPWTHGMHCTKPCSKPSTQSLGDLSALWGRWANPSGPGGLQTTHNSSFQQSDKDQHVCVTDVDWHACLAEEQKTSKKLKVSGNVESGGLALGETLSWYWGWGRLICDTGWRVMGWGTSVLNLWNTPQLPLVKCGATVSLEGVILVPGAWVPH